MSHGGPFSTKLYIRLTMKCKREKFVKGDATDIECANVFLFRVSMAVWKISCRAVYRTVVHMEYR